MSEKKSYILTYSSCQRKKLLSDLLLVSEEKLHSDLLLVSEEKLHSDVLHVSVRKLWVLCTGRMKRYRTEENGGLKMYSVVQILSSARFILIIL